jgi:hypothetical protein
MGPYVIGKGLMMLEKEPINYPAEILINPALQRNWIKGLTKAEIHRVVNDKELPIPLMEELYKLIPEKMLVNLIRHKKLPSDLRPSILRRLFKAKSTQMSNQQKMKIFSDLSYLTSWPRRERQIVDSYIHEIQKKLASGKSEKLTPKKKLNKKSNHSSNVYLHKLTKVANVDLDATYPEVAKYLMQKCTELVKSETTNNGVTDLASMYAHLAIKKGNFGIPEVPLSLRRYLSNFDILKFRFEIDLGVISEQKFLGSQELLISYGRVLKGDLAKTILDDIDTQQSSLETLYSLILRTCSNSNHEYIIRKNTILEASTSVVGVLNRFKPLLNYGRVEVTNGGMASIDFSSSPNLKFSESSLRVWSALDGESKCRSVKFLVDFDPETYLLRCRTTLTKLNSGERYFYSISGTFQDEELRLPPREFKVPDFVPSIRSMNSKDTHYLSLGAPVPFGGGGERRFNQLGT